MGWVPVMHLLSMRVNEKVKFPLTTKVLKIFSSHGDGRALRETPKRRLGSALTELMPM